MTLNKFINLKIVGFGILIWLLFKIDIPKTFEILSESQLFYLSLALLFMFTHLFIKFLRYQYILTQQGIKNPLLKTIHFSLAALYLSFVTPGRMGEISKAFFIHQTHGGAISKFLASSLIDRVFDVYTLLFMAIMGLAFFNPLDADPVPMIMTILFIGLIPFLLLIRTVRGKFLNLIGLIEGKIRGTDTWAGHLRFFFLKLTFF